MGGSGGFLNLSTERMGIMNVDNRVVCVLDPTSEIQ